MKQLKILFASPEVAPFAKTGGLADVSAALPAALARAGHKVMIVMPLYRFTKEGKYDLLPVDGTLEVPFKGQLVKDRAFYLKIEPNLRVYFIRKDEFFDRRMLYGTSEGDYFDNADRYIFFSRAVIHLCKLINFKPDIIHCNDWQTSLIPVYLRTLYKDEPCFRNSRTVFTIHNLAYQGIFSRASMEASGLPLELFSIGGVEYYGKMNFMKGGIVFSDVITTVSEKYSQEIRTPEYGYSLEGVLRERSTDIYGVLNGVDYNEWNPEIDPHIPAQYSRKNLAGKKKCKEDLRQVFELKGAGESPVIGMISRLAGQKGFDLLEEALDGLMKMDLFLVLLGKGDEKYEKMLVSAAERYNGRIGLKIAFDNILAHKIEAGSDMFLMPSRYEPCGLNQMFSLKYGTIPIVRATGGLDDTIKDFSPNTGKGNGVKFSEYSSKALIEAVKRALTLNRDKKCWKKLMDNAMKEDFSWKKSAQKYGEVYEKALSAAR